MPRKNKRSDSAHVQTEIIKDLIKGIQVPKCVKLRKEDKPFWEAIMKARAEWTEIDLIIAANLARTLCDIETYQERLDQEGGVVRNAKGTPIQNPVFGILETLSRRQSALASKIQVNASATMGEAKLSKGKNTAKRKAAENLQEPEEESLIARPSTH